MLRRHEANPQEKYYAEARSQKSRLAILLKPHPRQARMRPENLHCTRRTCFSRGIPLGDCFCMGKAFYKELSFTDVLKNILALKNKWIIKWINKQTKNIEINKLKISIWINKNNNYLVKGPRSFRKVLRFLTGPCYFDSG